MQAYLGKDKKQTPDRMLSVSFHGHIHFFSVTAEKASTKAHNEINGILRCHRNLVFLFSGYYFLATLSFQVAGFKHGTKQWKGFIN